MVIFAESLLCVPAMLLMLCTHVSSLKCITLRTGILGLLLFCRPGDAGAEEFEDTAQGWLLCPFTSRAHGFFLHVGNRLSVSVHFYCIERSGQDQTQEFTRKIFTKSKPYRRGFLDVYFCKDALLWNHLGEQLCFLLFMLLLSNSVGGKKCIRHRSKIGIESWSFESVNLCQRYSAWITYNSGFNRLRWLIALHEIRSSPSLRELQRELRMKWTKTLGQLSQKWQDAIFLLSSS